MRFTPALLLSLILMGTTAPLLASQEQEADKPVTNRDVSAGDVVRTPISDLNLRKGDIPDLLIAAQADPYGVADLRKCPQLSAAVADLDAVLGDDIDLPTDGKPKISAGRVAQAAVGSFIPFRGLIREISGANEQDRRLLLAVQAGFARRAFLKGYGQARGCRYPARAAPLQMQASAPAATAKSSAREKRQRGQKVQFTSQPVVQKVD
ncbi:hypothetical protein [Novosphingobium sp.]|uniref:hypothetical protein n=1 Tax=Novosphingobium sp. TaxID=1874826 RepID=UPI00273571F3|nr:hypothetical protein [Novosphingobium sp.]MDP3908024.1 hypothetical protein [Novosphingobium sp.]